jgi:hypothetical protein
MRAAVRFGDTLKFVIVRDMAAAIDSCGPCEAGTGLNAGV